MSKECGLFVCITVYNSIIIFLKGRVSFDKGDRVDTTQIEQLKRKLIILILTL